MNITFFWDVVACSLVKTNRRFRSAYCIYYRDYTAQYSRKQDSISPFLWVYSTLKWKLAVQAKTYELRDHGTFDCETGLPLTTRKVRSVGWVSWELLSCIGPLVSGWQVKADAWPNISHVKLIFQTLHGYDDERPVEIHLKSVRRKKNVEMWTLKLVKACVTH
jgi:hypothetical protein